MLLAPRSLLKVTAHNFVHETRCTEHAAMCESRKIPKTVPKFNYSTKLPFRAPTTIACPESLYSHRSREKLRRSVEKLLVFEAHETPHYLSILKELQGSLRALSKLFC